MASVPIYQDAVFNPGAARVGDAIEFPVLN